MNRLLLKSSECKLLSTCRRNQIFVKSFRNIPSQVSTYLVVRHLIPPPPPQHILNNQEVPINVLLRQAMVKMTIVRS